MFPTAVTDQIVLISEKISFRKMKNNCYLKDKVFSHIKCFLIYGSISFIIGTDGECTFSCVKPLK
jgi:Na+-transporting NADH:ubiquinone oxidoreductase subunit NqrB